MMYRKTEEICPDILKDIKAVLFDMDGTLTDSMWLWKDIDIEYLGRFGVELPSDLQERIEGMGFTETAQFFQKEFSIPHSIEQIKADWNNMAMEKYSTQVPLKKGAWEFLAYLADHGIRMGIATSNSIELAMAALRANNVCSFFGCIRTACDVSVGKPAPDIYLSAASVLNADPSECLVFEDVPMGILAGHNAGMKVCAVEDPSSRSRKKQIRDTADYYIKDYFEILNGTYETLNAC